MMTFDAVKEERLVRYAGVRGVEVIVTVICGIVYVTPVVRQTSTYKVDSVAAACDRIDRLAVEARR
jgi:hypothetical protein